MNAEVESEHFALNCRNGYLFELGDTGLCIGHTIGDLLSLEIDHSADDESNDENEGPSKCSSNDAKEKKADDDRKHRAGQSDGADLGQIRFERDNGNIEHEIRLTT